MRIAQGAEAVIERDGDVVRKVRVSKGYRHPDLDDQLRKRRTRAEARILEKLQAAGIPAPCLISSDEKTMELCMEFVEGPKLRDVLGAENHEEYARQIGDILRKMHEHNIIHSDLTTSNMIVRDGKVVPIDFGLSFISRRIEDKAVDLHLLHRALDSYHHGIASKTFEIIRSVYKEPAVLDRLRIIESRGRYKQKA